MKYTLLFFWCILYSAVYGQVDLAADTILYTEKTGGAIDTFDVAHTFKPTTFDGGRELSGVRAFSVNQLFQDYSGYRLNQTAASHPLRYSSLPHLGFLYSFGSQGTQFLHLKFTQAFTPNFLFNLTYNRRTGTGFLRNSVFTGDNVNVKLQRIGQRYSMTISGAYQSYQVDHPNGVTTDSLIIPFGLEFSPVLRTANSETKMGSLEWQNFLNFTNDSLNHFGLVSKHRYSILNRKYFEFDAGNLPDYNLYNYDSTNTQDSWNNPSIENGAGVYFLNRKTNFYIDGTLNHRYWNSWDIENFRDTNEIHLNSELRFEWKGIALKNALNFNLIGGFNGWKESASARYQAKSLTISGSLLLASIPADPIQRFYYGNNYNYQLNTINRQVWLKIGGDIQYQLIDSLLNIETNVHHFSIPSAYTFNGIDWQLNDSLGSASSLGLKAHLSLGAFNWIPQVILTSDKNNFIPTFQAYSRIYMKGRLFKAKKLQATIGIDASYQNGYQLRAYIPSIDAFYWGGTNNVSNPGQVNFDFFASLGIEQFRFYARFENIGYFWTDRTLLEAIGYPIAGTRVRVGITWDFFN